MKNIGCECQKVAKMFVEKFGGKVSGTTFIPPVEAVYSDVMEFCRSIPRHVLENGEWVPVE